MKYSIQYETHPKANEVQILNNGIMEQAKQKKEMGPIEFFAFFIRDEMGKVMGGCNGDNLYGCLYIGQLWVDELLRGKGFGTQLMLAAEDLAKKRGCYFMAVNTMDWEALGFYKKLGFYVEFERHGFQHNSIFYFLRKNIAVCHW